jgi:hypothetical protein
MKTISGCPPTDGQSKVQANPDTNLTATGASSGSMQEHEPAKSRPHHDWQISNEPLPQLFVP